MSTKKPDQETESVESASKSSGVKMRRDGETVEVVSPSLVTKLKSQGWEAAE